MSDLDKFLNRLDEHLANDGYTPPPRKEQAPLEATLDRVLGVITESIDGFLDLLTKGWQVDPNKMMGYLKTASPEEVTDWVNALQIAVVDRGWQGRWILGLAQKTSALPNLPQEIKPVLMGVLEELNAVPWPTVGPQSEEEEAQHEEEATQQERAKWYTEPTGESPEEKRRREALERWEQEESEGEEDIEFTL